MNVTKYILRLFLGAFVLTMIAGCSFMGGELGPNSHFAYPNSDVEPLGNVSAEISRTKFLSAQFVDQEMIDEVLTAAVKQKGGDSLINYKLSVTTTQIPLLPIYTTTLRVSGTAVKATIGQQQLR